MHILILPSEHFITKTQPLAGIFQHHQAKALAKFGHKVGVLSVGFITPRYLFKTYKYNKNEILNDVNIKRNYNQLYFPHRYMPIKILKNNYIKMAHKLYNEYTKEHGKPDIIHAHNFLYAGIIASYLKAKYKINYIITEHSTGFARGFFAEEYDEEIKKSYTNASVVTAVSSPFISLISKRTNLDVKLLANIVDEYFFAKAFENQKKDNFTFFNVASLDDKKNHRLLLLAFSKIYKNKNVFLNIAGDGPLEKQLKELSNSLGIQNQVEFLGRINQEKVREEMMSSDCFVLSSNYETFGVVLIEALSCGLPLIATKCGGPEDIVNETNGILVDVENKKQLEDAMMFMYDKAKKYDREVLREDAKERFADEVFVRRVEKYYEIGIKNDK